MGVACGVEVCNVEHPGRRKRPRNRHHPQKKLINTRRGEGGEGWMGGPLWSPGGGGQAHRASTSRSLQMTRAVGESKATSIDITLSRHPCHAELPTRVTPGVSS